MTKLPSEREQMLLLLPWVSKLKKPQECQGWMRSKKKCKNPAYWRFRSLETSWAHDGPYCQSHLYSRGIFGDMREEARTYRMLYKKRFLCQSREPVSGARCVERNKPHDEHHTWFYRDSLDTDDMPLRCRHRWTD